MINVKQILQDIEGYQKIIAQRGMKIDLEEFLNLYEKINKKRSFLDEIKNKKNIVSKEIPNLSNDEKAEKIAEMKKLGDEAIGVEEELKIQEERYNYIYHRLPNFLDETVPIDPSGENNEVVSYFGEKTKFDFNPKSHIEIGEAKGWIDLEKGAEVSGARFWYLKGNLALLNMAIVNFAIEKAISKGFEFVIPPYMVKEASLFGTGFLPAGEDGVYAVNPGEDDLFLIGTSEIPLTSYHMNEIIDVSKPILYVGYSPCFRKEGGSYGKDMKGILRGHQFEKVEMVAFCKPEDSKKVHDFLAEVEEEVWQDLGIPYQKINICSGDLGAPALKKYDLEAWIPTQEKYREVTSTSNIGEFQSRRLNIKYRNEDGNLEFVHTLNGTVIALSRCLIAIMENYQDENGDVIIPEVLRKYLGGRDRI